MKYLTGSTNDRDEPAIAAAGLGLMIQPGNSYHLRVDRYSCWAADNGCFNPETYIGDDAWLEWLDRLPREGCLFAAVPDVARRPDGELGGDPVATWAKFEEYGPLVQAMGFPAALVAQDGMELMPNVAEQLDACDALFLGGSTEWKLGPGAESLARIARALGKWVHMGRVNSARRLRRAAEMGCNSADGTKLAYLKRASGNRVGQGPVTIRGWVDRVNAEPMLWGFESPSHKSHRPPPGP